MQRPSPVCRRSDRDLALFLNRRLRRLLRETRRQQDASDDNAIEPQC